MKIKKGRRNKDGRKQAQKKIKVHKDMFTEKQRNRQRGKQGKGKKQRKK